MESFRKRLAGVVVAFLVAYALATSGALSAESRIALVVGNSRYAEVPQLINPARDAETISATLKRLGFTTVTLRHDLGRDAMNSALHAFAREAEKADWAVVYFAGHGIEYAGVNYLVPTDATLASDRDVQFETLPLNQVLGSVEGARKLRLVILDACRDNPFLSRMKRSVASRSVGRGLTRVEPNGGVLVAFAAKDGEVALDGDGTNSPFTSALIKHIETPGLEINRLFRRVRSEVLTETRQRQEPYVYGSLPDEDFFFTPATIERLSAVVAAPEPVDRLNGPETAARAAEQPDIASSRASSGVIESHNNGDGPAGSNDGKAAEAKSPVDSAKGDGPEAAPASPVRVAAVPSEQKPTGPEQRAPSSTSTSIDLAKGVQSELRRLGCEMAEIDGSWGEKNRAGLVNYGRHAGRSLDPEQLNDAVLDDMKKQRARVCPIVCGRGYSARGDACILKSCPRNRVRDADGDCIAALRPKAPVKAIAHTRERPAETFERSRAIEKPAPRAIAPPPPRFTPPKPRIQATPAPKPVVRIVRPAPAQPARAAPSRRCQTFNGQSICD